MTTHHARLSRVALAALLALMALPSCKGGQLNPTSGAFQASPLAVEFGRVLEGHDAGQPVTIEALSRTGVTVSASTAAPFSVAPSIDVPGGGEATLTVSFVAGDAGVSGVLTLSAGDTTVEVTLHGIGVHPPECAPAGPCRPATYSLEEDRCVVSVLPDDTMCDPQNLCLEKGRCLAGECNGVPRNCDDDNVCTDDGCSEQVGCVNTPHQCPAPGQLCRVATCDSKKGCGVGLAPDFSQCGPADCKSFSGCLLGVCTTFTDTDGIPCAPAMACLSAGQCKDHECAQTLNDWLPQWVAPLDVVPSSAPPALLSAGTSLFFSACGLKPLASDGGSLDDGGTPDGGLCGLVSFTRTGFDRFATPYADGLERSLIHVSDRGVLVAGPPGLEYRSSSSGLVEEALDRRPPRDGVASSPDGAVLLLDGDGGLETWTRDGGARWLASAGGARVLSLDERGLVYLWDANAGVVSRLAPLDDGGLSVQELRVDAGWTSLTVVGDRAVVGSNVVVAPGDGGLEAIALAWSDWPSSWVPRGALQSSTQAFSFSRQDAGTWLSAHELATGQLAWQVEAMPADGGTQLWEATLFTLSGQVGVATVNEVRIEDQSRSALEVFNAGTRLLVCPLPPESSQLRGALFSGSSLYVIVDRPDGGHALESYPLGALPAAPLGWSAPEGKQGWRRP